MKRNLNRVITPKPQQGFLGPGHIAKALIDTPFAESDPFILLMDDKIEVPSGEPVGGPHPHAGFETVSLLLEGEIGDEAHMMQTGDFQIMTAGSGIVHTESIEKKTRLRLLQMWLNLPKKDRWATPRVQDLAFGSVPKISENGLELRLYSGEMAGLKSPVQNHTPLIVAEIHLQPGVVTRQQLDASYNAFLYVVDGSIEVGDSRKILNENQIGWLSRSAESGESELILTGGNSGGKVVLYAAEPQNHPIVSYGPFIADKEEEIKDLYRDFRHGKIGHVSALPAAQKFSY